MLSGPSSSVGGVFEVVTHGEALVAFLSGLPAGVRIRRFSTMNYGADSRDTAAVGHPTSQGKTKAKPQSIGAT